VAPETSGAVTDIADHGRSRLRKMEVIAPKKTDSFETIGLILKLLILLFQ
jgi:hypothetical protein